MDSESCVQSADFFLRDIPNIKKSNTKDSHDTRKVVKQELQFLHLSGHIQEDIVDTIKFIHGKEFVFDDASMYKNANSNFIKKYWTERGNLVVKGGFDYSQVDNKGCDDVERLKTFALLRLESYGFYKEHCLEAFEYSNCDLDSALHLLYSKYFNIQSKKDIEHNLSEKELIELRMDEKSSLESIYEKQFLEKVKDTVWILTLKLDYLINIFHKRDCDMKRKVEIKKKKEMCKGFIRGNCKYGNNCRFSHEREIVNLSNTHLNNYSFELEIRFPYNTKYPFEPPIIFLKTNAVIPSLSILHICKKLYEEAMHLAEDGIPSVYTVAELLQNETVMLNHLKKDPEFIKNYEKLFPPEIKTVLKSNRPTHYKKGFTNKDNKTNITFEDISIENRKLVQKFMAKTKDGKYIKILRNRKELPAWNMSKDILNTIELSQVTIITGDTGCGKSTQVPQFILDDWLINYSNKNNKHLEIVCTQPRRISAVSVAQRVADERVEGIGFVVGYHIRLESKVSTSTRLTFCTTRILLRRLENDPLLSKVTHIIVDEVHERSEESDFLLLILKDLLHLRPDLKIILMSATLNAKVFSEYFGIIPTVEIPGRTFPVEQYFLEDILEMTDYVLEENSEYSKHIKWTEESESYFNVDDCIADHLLPKNNIKDESLTFPQVAARYIGYSKKTCKNLYFWDYYKINYDFIETVLTWIASGDHSYSRQGSILIFLPGIAEISTLYDRLKIHPEFSPKYEKYVLVPLHSSLTTEEQAAVFMKMRAGVRKIVISTNIAETSVTIDDCVFVIDCGKMKEKHFDSNRNMESLETVWVTRANAMQRKGRAGRVMSGVCLHLYTNHRFKFHMLPEPIPEIHRKPLEQLLLNIKVLPNFITKDIYQVLGGIIEPPRKENIDSSIVRLQHVGAFDKINNLTALGHHLAALPVDVRIGKLMLYGAIFNCVDAALTMAACLSYKSPFIAPFNKKDQADAKKRRFSLAYSDHITTLNAYQKWHAANRTSYQAGRNFADENFLSYKTLQMIVKIKYQFLELLVSIGFIPIDTNRKYQSNQDEIATITGLEFNKNGENTRLLSAILCAALYPNLIKVLTPGKSFQGSAVGAVPKEPDVKDLKFKTKYDWVVLHPSSVNSIVKTFPSPYLVYQEIVKTSKIFIRDCTMVPVVPLVLFSSFDIEINVCNGNTFVVLDDGWIVFQVEDHRVAEMIKIIRIELQNLLEEKIMDPLLNLHHHDKGERIISTIINVVTDK